MKKSTIRKVEDILRDYPNIEGYIKARESEMRYASGTLDENIGGGRAQYKYNDSFISTLITIDEDRMLRALKRQRDIVDDCLEYADEDTKVIIYELYFKRNPRYTLIGLVENNLLSVGRTQAYDLRNRFVESVAKDLGLFDF